MSAGTTPGLRQLPPMPDFRPGGNYVPGGPLPSNAAFQALMDQVALLSKTPQVPGFYGAMGFFPEDKAVGAVDEWVTCLEPLMPGAFDFPSYARAQLLTGRPGPLQNSGEPVDIVNYSPNIFAPTGGLVLVDRSSSPSIAKHSSC